ncbi:MAG: hypothetical protein GX604_00020 [Actinobacteria bacterium]|nr:hypothetical protein [Actinomycetota bacterium]
MVVDARISVTRIPELSAIYFALLQCGYGYYAVGKDAALVRAIESFHTGGYPSVEPFFSKVRRDGCDTYPYWPRAALLEAATFFLDGANAQFRDVDAFRRHVMSASNISDAERNDEFWCWMRGFPAALGSIMADEAFRSYLRWEEEWIAQQRRLLENDLSELANILDTCAKYHASRVRQVSVVLTAIKCAYSADYHIAGNRLFYCAGAFRKESVVHEFLHHAIRPSIVECRELILRHDRSYPDIDPSYYLRGDERGRLNAFEEYLVRKLTPLAVADRLPPNLGMYIREILAT